LSGDNLHREIDEGIASVSAALGDPKELAPFFRIPGLHRTDEIDHELAAHSLVTFSADVVADDWYHSISPARIIKRAMSDLRSAARAVSCCCMTSTRQRSLPCLDSYGS
jgi:peptidoglycan-N-acetylglucosamine deacetylase